ncbi:MAG TPA: bifunctional UDP-N-acetylglucosamine diphosphorylase/glucosamine-1-phosphate N-acetyltransferase GlmU [bacterium]|jgi:bifunctional UDP-N-acetylglucosamine pyrophosphorylase/glucosamine-1-phosphate N-acetyltransferase|nr:bifunctional UDP-N-acetylglucosamine diphosphorylase/glucosamine-1-phosphate N-acetyltransferase GlmU [bacterium]
MNNLTAVILAAGKGMRMKSSRPKVLHELCGRPLISYVVDAAKAAGASDVVLVINSEMKAVHELFGNTVKYAYQDRRLGTGHALQVAREAIGSDSNEILVLCGDAPLLSFGLLRNLVQAHRSQQAAATVLTAQLPDPSGYGRIIRADGNVIERIVEEQDATPAEKAIKEVNSGSYCFDGATIFSFLEQIECHNVQGEYYLTDVLPLIKAAGGLVLPYLTAEADLVQGINNRLQLAAAEAWLRAKIRERQMLAGVTIIDPSTVFIDATVCIGADTVIYPFTILEGQTVIGENCIIGPSVQIEDSIIRTKARVRHAVVTKAEIGPGADVGPYTHLRPETKLGPNSKAGTFVEIKKADIGPESKVPHMAYVGDAVLGQGANIGAGTITCNYDGEQKHLTEIGDGAFIGSNTNLVAPVRIGRGAYTGAGSTITKDVPAGALALERAQQKNIEGWAEKRRQKAHLRKKEE